MNENSISQASSARQMTTLSKALPLLAVISVVSGMLALHQARQEQYPGFFAYAKGSPHSENSISFSRGDGNAFVEAKLSGEVSFDDSESDVAHLTPNGTFMIIEKTPGMRREIHYSSFKGRLIKDYRVNGKAAEIDHRWLRAMIPEVLRNSTINLADRSRRIYSKEGVRGILAEASKIEESFARASYLNMATSYGSLEDPDFELFLDAANHVSEDVDRASVISHIFTIAQTEDRQAATLRLIGPMRDSYQISSLMRGMLPRVIWGEKTLSAWKTAFLSVSNAFNQREVLVDMMDRSGEDKRIIVSALHLSSHILSDYDKRVALERAVPKIDSSAAEEAYASSLASIRSPSDASLAALAYSNRHNRVNEEKSD